jgi:hypothetical protein
MNCCSESKNPGKQTSFLEFVFLLLDFSWKSLFFWGALAPGLETFLKFKQEIGFLEKISFGCM